MADQPQANPPRPVAPPPRPDPRLVGYIEKGGKPLSGGEKRTPPREGDSRGR